jgi:hypothetical protein
MSPVRSRDPSANAQNTFHTTVRNASPNQRSRNQSSRNQSTTNAHRRINTSSLTMYFVCASDMPRRQANVTTPPLLPNGGLSLVNEMCKWYLRGTCIGCGAKLNLSKSPDADVLKKIIIKLQKRVLAGAATLLVKVKAHRGNPLNEEVDIRAEMGRHKEPKEVGWNDPTDRTIYRWKVGQQTRSTAWTNTVRNRFRQKAGEIEVFRALEIGVAKWCKEHIPHKDNDLNDITEEGISLLDDTEVWGEKQNLLWACHASSLGSKDRVNNDGSFVTHQIGAISSTFTSDWYLRKGDSRDKMGECLEKKTVRSQDQRRMLQANTHSFPSNYWRNKITKGKESDKCDLCTDLWIVEGRFNTEDGELPIQTLGHIQHQCEALSEIHTLAHHRCWCIIHAELRRLASSKWRFICINGEKTLKTIWNELEVEFPEIFNHCSVKLLENVYNT